MNGVDAALPRYIGRKVDRQSAHKPTQTFNLTSFSIFFTLMRGSTA
jgi:hypothetical protein